MARRYLVATAKAGVNVANTVMWQLRTAAANRAFVTEVAISVALASTTAPNFVLARPTATGATPTTVTPLTGDNGTGSPATLLETAWGTAPTFTTTGPFLKSFTLTTTPGSALIWMFPQAIEINANSGLIIANVNASGATLGSFTLSMVFDE